MRQIPRKRHEAENRGTKCGLQIKTLTWTCELRAMTIEFAQGATHNVGVGIKM